MRIGIIGGGAAGFFAAIAVKENYPNAEVIIFEKARKVLSKVKISGGGRCNVTNGCTSIPDLCEAYPRGGRSLKKVFHVFNTTHTMDWFQSRGVPLVIQDDNCVFPVSQDSQSIIDCFLKECRRLGVQIKTQAGVSAIQPKDNGLELNFLNENQASTFFDKVIVTTGGSPKKSGLNWLEALGHKIESPVPSLFTFNIPNDKVTQLMGVVVEKATVSIQGTKLKAEGPLLITHWGMSGPAILKLSAFGARLVNEKDYDFKVLVNWCNEQRSDKVLDELHAIVMRYPNKVLANVKPFGLSERLWLFLLDKCELSSRKKWSELGKKGMNRLINTLSNDEYSVKGISKFREEFVTCGGVSRKSINLNTMESKVCENLYFAGEVLDIDAITGGYNLQAAWSTGFVAAQLK
ncbi:BaiN/RdsA family NAD(P)/FAD-dependent oxidoreductase [Carboxylicivirga marina]|uniref:NAD(P)/FAD-dependent oxidoreductase n=1 Tax=Carboxylicivirga marina TaxID=2800988 RepID=A0ABS1HHL6_9BACT|nr:NAD(P)/FAD-dependent oxidoreductase [Carboxylicivirga marina]MBK3517172.1 NAD(P)/FAD-dependent oxidoreductase [Carboxylicivirga marina]